MSDAEKKFEGILEVFIEDHEWGSAPRQLAQAIHCTIESAGLRIVDSSLFQALVEAVRARVWANAAKDTWYAAFTRDLDDVEELALIFDDADAGTAPAHARAAALLAERGE